MKNHDETSQTLSSNLKQAIALSRNKVAPVALYGTNDDGTCNCDASKSCKRPGRHPIAPKLVGHHFSRKRDSDLYNDNNNIGVPTGKKGGCIAIVVKPKGQKQFLEISQKFGIPLTQTIKINKTLYYLI